MKKIIILSTLFLSLYSCKKEAILDEIEEDKVMAEDNSIAEKNSDDASIMSDEAYDKGELTSRGGSGTLGGAIVTKDTINKKITIDFGTGVIGRDGKIRKGKITITYTGPYYITGTVITQTFSNYFVNGHQITGTRTITNNGGNSWTIAASLTIIKSNGKTITWTSTRTRTKIATGEFNITGSASGTTSTGKSYTITIGTPLYVKIACDNIQSGTITYTRGTKSATVDYSFGTGTPCDDQAEVTLSNGTKHVITLP